MKVSNKLLLAIAGLLILLLVAGLAVLRNDLQRLLFKEESARYYKQVPVESFESLHFSENWIIKIRQGNEHKVELSTKETAVMKHKLENINGTLYFTRDTISKEDNIQRMHARVTAPNLKKIKVAKGTTIRMDDFASDSVHVVLENGSVFKGNNNDFKKLFFKTTGDATLEFTTDN